MFYHVYVEYFAGEGKNRQVADSYEKDLQTLDKIRRYYIKPVLEQKTMLLSGRVVRPEDLKIFRILQSEEPLGEIRKKINKPIPGVITFGLSEEALLKGHVNELVDITNEVLNGEF